MTAQIISLQSIRCLICPETKRNQYDHCASKIRVMGAKLMALQNYVQQEEIKDPYLTAHLNMCMDVMIDAFNYAKSQYDLSKEAC